MIYRLYRILIRGFYPFLYLWVRFRILIKKEDPDRVHERFGYTRLSRPLGPVYWFHGASNGECLSFLSFLKHLQGKYPDVHFLVTSGTLTSAKLLKKSLPTRAFHQFLPLDHPVCVKRFLDHWDPSAVFWTESDLWPNLLMETSKRGVPMTLLNGRLSDKSLKRWQKVPGFIKSLLNVFKVILPASPKHQENYKKLGVGHATYVGNLKFSARPLSYNKSGLQELKNETQDRPVWVAACTHPGEEDLIVDVHKELKQHLPNLLTIVVPRHPHRAKSLETLWKTHNLKYGHRSLNQPIDNTTELYVFDTTGELGLIYGLTSVAFIGGSLVQKIGGHNPIEAAQLKCCVLTGPYITGNANIYDLFNDQDACFIVQTHQELAKIVLQLLTNEALRAKYIGNAEKLTMAQQNTLAKIVKKLEEGGIIHDKNTQILVQER